MHAHAGAYVCVKVLHSAAQLIAAQLLLSAAWQGVVRGVRTWARERAALRAESAHAQALWMISSAAVCACVPHTAVKLYPAWLRSFTGHQESQHEL